MTLSDEGRRLVDDARAGYGPAPADRARVLSALAARVAASAAASGSAAASLSGVAAAKGTILGVVAVAAIGAVSVGYWRSGRDARVTPPPVTTSAVRDPDRAPAPVANEPPPASPPAEAPRERPHRARSEPRLLRAAARSPAPPAAAPAPLAAAPAPPPATPAPLAATPAPLAAAPRPDVVPETRPDVAGEVALLARAQKALADGDFRRCLRLLDRHAAAFPRGMLTEERAAARIIALCGLGRVETARDELGAFLSRAPASPLAERVKHACGAAWPAPP
jgi:hypothetical protein